MTRSGQRTSRQSPLQTAGRLAALLVALLGLFVMHGLADHGSAGHGSMPGMTTPMVAASDAVAHETHEATDVVGQRLSSDSAAPLDGGHDDSGLLGLCLAIVGTMLLFAAGALLSWGRLPLRVLLASRSEVVAWARARDPAPPDLTRLCIQRC